MHPLQGNNLIESVQRGCALREQWRSVRGGTGESLNYLDPGRNQWRQLWLDAGASIIDISGGLEDGSMVLEGTIEYLNGGKIFPFRGTWTPLEDGRVRQFFQQEDDYRTSSKRTTRGPAAKGRQEDQQQDDDKRTNSKRTRGPAARGRQEDQQQEDNKMTSSKRTIRGPAARGQQGDQQQEDDKKTSSKKMTRGPAARGR